MNSNPRHNRPTFDTEAFLRRLVEDGTIPLDFAQQFIEYLGPFDHVRVRNHWVPITYLKAFTDTGTDEGRLWMYSRDLSQPKRIGVVAVASEKYLYVEPELDIPDIVERILAKVEGTFNTIRHRLIVGLKHGVLSPLSTAERFSLALFLSFQQARTPYAREQAEQMARFDATFDLRVKLQNPREVQREYKEVTGKRISRKEIKRWRRELDSGELQIEPSKGNWIGTFLKVAFENAPVIADLPLRLVKNKGLPFPTTDMPVIMTSREEGTVQYGDNAGWIGRNAEVLFPITPNDILVIGKSCGDRVIATREWCDSARRATIQHSHRFLFSREEDEGILELLAETEAPENVLEYDGRQHSISEPVGAVVKQIFEGKGDILRFGPRRSV